VEINNNEVATEHNYKRQLSRVFNPWRHYAHEKAIEERNEIIVRENQLKLEQMLLDAEEATKMMVRIEKEKEVKAQEEEVLKKQAEKKLAVERSKQVMKAEKLAESRLLLSIQREVRRKRVESEMDYLKLRFNVEFEHKAQQLYAKAKDRITGYIENPDNKLALELRFQQLKREFFANPTPETKEREKILSSYKNILFLYIEAKLLLENKDIHDIIPAYDNGSKGYLTYGEFGNLIRSIGANLNESQISSVIRGVDLDKDGYIDFSEINSAMKDINQMGVPGSPWKLYIDPSEDVICYHNFLTNEKYHEYQINDKVFKSIVIANLYGETEYKTRHEINQLRKEEWSVVLANYMAVRVQYLYRQWKARKWRKKKVWKVEKRVLQFKTKQQKAIIKFIERVHYSYQTRVAFKKQLHLTIEKLYDPSSQQLFYYNHHNSQTCWSLPLLLRRYGDVTMPCIWIPLDDQQEGNQKKKKSKNTSPLSPTLVTGYYHILAKREFPAKPDGFPLCHSCSHLLAIRTCRQCNVHYCFACHRKSHGHPLGFSQKTKAKRKQYTNPRKFLLLFCCL
jgi:hypothetical protein